VARRRLLRLTRHHSGAADSAPPFGAPMCTHSPARDRCPTSVMMTHGDVRIGPTVATRVDVDVDVIKVPDRVQQVMAHGLGHIMTLAHGQVFSDQTAIAAASRCPTQRACTEATRGTPPT
jgi:hypothetical protein